MTQVVSQSQRHWPIRTVGELATAIQYGYTAKSNRAISGPKYLRITDIQDDAVDWPQVPSCEIDKEDIAKYRLKAGDLVFARTGATVGKSYLIRLGVPLSVFASYLIRIRFGPEVDSRYVAYFFSSPSYWRQVTERQAGIGQPNVNGKKLAQVKLPVAPIEEQQKVIAEIEKQFSRLDDAVTNLKRVKANLKRYKAAVLKAAVEGRLVPTEAELARSEGRSFELGEELLKRVLETRRNQWKDKSRYKEPVAPEPINGFNLPDGWTWCGFQQISQSHKHALKAGPFGSALKKEMYVEIGYKIYGQEQVIRGDSNYCDYFIDEKKYRQLESCAVRPRDLLVSLVGTAGKVLVLPEGIIPGIINPRLLKLSLNGAFVLPQFAAIVLQSSWASKFFKREAHGGTMEILNLGIIKSLPVPLPALAEQGRIVSEVERCLSFTRSLDRQIDANLGRAEALRQTILSRSFSG